LIACQESSCKVKKKWKERYSEKFRRRAVARMNACDNKVRLSREFGLKSSRYKWRYRLERPDGQIKVTASTENCRESTLRREITKLNRSLADNQLSRSAYRRALFRVPEVSADDGRLVGA
jgi:transposase-like protein